jgi:high-affinity iron transporter
MLASLLIVFREVIEAGLIVGIVLAASKGARHRIRWVAYGVAGGLAGACLVALFAGELASLFAGSGAEIFNGSILLIAVCMLTWHNVWMSAHGREISAEMRRVGAAVVAGERTLSALSVVVGVAILREGSEVVLFLYGIASQGGASGLMLLCGALLGLAAGALLSTLIYFGLLAIPVHRLFAVTSGLITLVAAGMAAQSILFFQQGGYLEFLTTPLWDTSAILPENSIAGRLLHTLVGYSDSPNGAQIAFYLATIAAITLLMRMERRHSAHANRKPAVPPPLT